MVDPITDAPIYVGITTNFEARRTAHFSGNQSAVHDWIKGLRRGYDA